ncbi:PP2C family protein-serine/threonine phosphatase [Frigidibacter sp. MR17.24]|uniref:PP2C family protein-serine/threonine phosphatase n=1 Tax=Frigidibacter sp. MR17.24 TaxID=3127345 RepID=UPI0030131725
MADTADSSTTAPGSGIAGRAGAVRRVLVVDDSRMQRRFVARLLAPHGYEVDEAASMDEALEIAAITPPDLVLSDWVMPGGDGLTLCARLRASAAGYIYFILMSSRTEKQQISAGLEAGADDFLTKPVHLQELVARIHSGARVLDMERRLRRKARLLADTLDELRQAQDAMDRDLQAARRLQERLVPERFRDFGGTHIALMLRPTGQLGGDLVGFFPINARRIGLFALDVSGHGVAAALVAAQLAGRLAAGAPERNVALYETELGIYDGRPPAEVASALNRLMLGEYEGESYATLLYCDLDMVTGRARLVQAGHPHPLLLGSDGGIEALGAGGFPIGLIEDADYDETEVTLTPGDRLLILSDGLGDTVTGQLGAALAGLWPAGAWLEGPDFLERLETGLRASAGRFDDDVSAVLIDYRRAKPEG